MIRWIKNKYHEMKRIHLGNWSDIVPEIYWSTFVCIGGAAEHTYMVRRLLRPLGRTLDILIVGVYGGRDFWALKLDRHRVTGLDLISNKNCCPTVVGDVEGKWPFHDGLFDVVIIGEILEHLIFDYDALKEAKRVLRSDGKLIGTVPFLHDSEEFHVRVHTPASLLRLLSISGFHVTDYIERPGLISLSWMNYPIHVVGLIYYIALGRSIYNFTSIVIGRIEMFLGNILWLPRKYLKLFGIINWGALFCANPTYKAMNYKKHNIDAFFQ